VSFGEGFVPGKGREGGDVIALKPKKKKKKQKEPKKKKKKKKQTLYVITPY